MVLERFDSELRVSLDGSVDVTESLRVRFSGEWQGIYRDLSLEHQTAQGRFERLKVEVMGVTNERGEALRFEAWREEGWTHRIQVWVPDARDATRTVVLRYRLSNVIRFFDEGSPEGPLDEVYWNVTGNRWDVPIEGSGARVILPDGVYPTQWAGYTGPAGSRGSDVEVEVQGSTVAFETTRALEPREGLTVAVGWTPGAVARPLPPSMLRRLLTEGWPAVLPFLTFLLAFRHWRREGRDPKRRAVTVQYEPPEGLSPTEAGTLVDHKAQMHDLTATLVDLAVRGYIHIEERADRKPGPFSGRDFFFHLKKPREEWGDLAPHERRYLEALLRGASYHPDGRSLEASYPLFDIPTGAGDGAGPGPSFASVPLRFLESRFYRDLPEIQQAVYDQLITKGYYKRDPRAVGIKWTAGGVLLVVLGIAAVALGMGELDFTIAPFVLGAALFVSGVILLVMGRFMVARTTEGARAMEGALGFKEFLSRVEEDRFKRMITSPEAFERFLPYAMAFRVEGKWAKAFEGMFSRPPEWYSGRDGGPFRTSSFARDLGRLSSRAGSAMSSRPSGSSGSSRSSGSGGGGSSGGGSGGGGGGGF
jgi:uncharacterized membrane protein YgcG